MTRDEWLQLWRTLVPAWYSAPLDEADSGGEIFRAWAAVLERVSVAVERSADDLFHLRASLGEHATGTVTLAADRVTGPVELMATSVVRQPGGPPYELTESVTLPADETPVVVPVRCAVAIYSDHQPGALQLVRPQFGDGGPPTYDGPGHPPDDWTNGVRVVDSSATEGGRFPSLELLAQDVGVSPQEDEDGADVAERCRVLPLVLTRPALVELATRIWRQYDDGEAVAWEPHVEGGRWHLGTHHLGANGAEGWMLVGWRFFRLDFPRLPEGDSARFYFGRSHFSQHWFGAESGHQVAFVRALCDSMNRAKGPGIPWAFTFLAWRPPVPFVS